MFDSCPSGLVVSSGWEPAEPLWRRVPTHGEDGRSLSDFMMIIPDLSRRSAAYRRSVIADLQGVLDAYRHAVVFADLNLRLNLLWVSVKPIPGICLELPTAVKHRVPEAMLVANRVEAMMSLARG
jgi:hypothetical protein